MPMKKFYISSIKGNSGISKYSQDFYQLVLKDKGYIYMDSGEDLITILSTISSRDQVHIEVGIFQQKEIEILFTMLRANYRNITVTLHDPPLVRYPFYQFKNNILNNISKLYDKYANSSGAAKPYIRKIKTIYALSKKGVESIKKKYGVSNVCYLPHIVNTGEMSNNDSINKNFIYFGFIGKNKGLAYALELHQQ